MDRSTIKAQIRYKMNGNLITVHVDENGNVYSIHDKKVGTPQSIPGAHPLVIMDVLEEMHKAEELFPGMSDKELEIQRGLNTVPTTNIELVVNNRGSTFFMQAECNGQPDGKIIPVKLTHFNGHKV